MPVVTRSMKNKNQNEVEQNQNKAKQIQNKVLEQQVEVVQKHMLSTEQVLTRFETMNYVARLQLFIEQMKLRIGCIDALKSASKERIEHITETWDVCVSALPYLNTFSNQSKSWLELRLLTNMFCSKLDIHVLNLECDLKKKLTKALHNYIPRLSLQLQVSYSPNQTEYASNLVTTFVRRVYSSSMKLSKASRLVRKFLHLTIYYCSDIAKNQIKLLADNAGDAKTSTLVEHSKHSAMCNNRFIV